VKSSAVPRRWSVLVADCPHRGNGSSIRREMCRSPRVICLMAALAQTFAAPALAGKPETGLIHCTARPRRASAGPRSAVLSPDRIADR
jgi:hypothetical protein